MTNHNLNPISAYLVSTNIRIGNYFDSEGTNIIEQIPIGKTTSGSLIDFDSNNLTFSEVNIRNIDKLTVTLLDNFGEPVDMGTEGGTKQAELFNIELSITEKK